MARYFGSPAAGAVALSPSATVTATKNAGNPTFNVNVLMENPINVSGTYYAPYILPAEDTIYLATASNRDGPWSAGAAIYTLTDIAWRSGRTILAAPFIILNPDSGNYTLFYDLRNSDSSAGCIGFAASATITGTYSDHGSAILSNGAGGAWDSSCVAEPSVTYDGSNWYMAYMGASTIPISTSEKVGIASTPRSGSGIATTWTKAAANPLPYGSAGTWNAALQADPTIFIENGYFWIWTLGHITITPAVTGGAEGLWYSTTPTTIASWAEHPSNPILSPTAATWDSARCFRGGILSESGIISGTYTGGTSLSTLTTYKGGNFRLNIT